MADTDAAATRPVNREGFGIAIICALPREADAVHALLDHDWDEGHSRYGKIAGDPNAYSHGAIGSHNVVVVHLADVGKVEAASAAALIRVSYPKIVLGIVVGICGAVSRSGDDEIVLGDVIISNGVIQYDLGRQFGGRFVRKAEVLDALGRPGREIRALLKKLQTIRELEYLQKKTVAYLALIQQKPRLKAKYPGLVEGVEDVLFKPEYAHAGDGPCRVACCSGPRVTRTRLKHDSPPLPEVHIGLIGSADTVMKSAEDRDRIAKEGGVIGFEMESAGAWDHFPCLVIKSACDYADSHKNKEWQPYAAATAAACMKAFLEYIEPLPPGT